MDPQQQDSWTELPDDAPPETRRLYAAYPEFRYDVPLGVFWDPLWYWCFFKIRTANRGVRRVALNAPQQILCNTWKQAAAHGKWLVHVKPRKEGASSFFAAAAFMQAIALTGQRIALVGYQEGNASALADMALTCYDSFDPRYRHLLPKRNTRAESYLDLPGAGGMHKSRIITAAASGNYPETGETNQLVVATEICKWLDSKSKAAWDSIRNSLSDESMLIAESTPLFKGDPHYQIWHDEANTAMHPDTRWLKCFIPWYWCPQYSAQPRPGWTPSQTVRNYADTHPLVGLPYLFWMDTVGLGKVRGDIFAFMREYPYDEDECWAAQGVSTFDLASLRAAEQRIKLTRASAGEEPDPWTWYKEPPVKGHVVLAIDPASELTERDYAGAQLIDCEHREQLADYWERCDIEKILKHIFALVELSRHPETGFRFQVVIEANGPGESLLSRCRAVGLTSPAPNAPQGYIVATKRGRGDSSPKLGWWADEARKSTGINWIKDCIADESLTLHSLRTIAQLKGFSGHWDTHRRDRKGGHFDLMAALAIAGWYVAARCTTYRPLLRSAAEMARVENAQLVTDDPADGGILFGGGDAFGAPRSLYVYGGASRRLTVTTKKDIWAPKASSLDTRWGRQR